MKITKTQLREIIRKELNKLNEEEYDFYRDYKSGSIDKKTYDDLVKRHQQRNPVNRGTAVFLNIKFNEKDKLKSKYGKALRWSPKNKSWYYLVKPGSELPSDLEKRKK